MLKKTLLFYLFVFLSVISLTAQNYNSEKQELSKLKKENKELKKKLSIEINRRKEIEIKNQLLENKIKNLTNKDSNTEQDKKNEWNSLIDRIIISLERVKDENNSFSSAVYKSDLVNEERRLKSLARSQEEKARSFVSDLKALKFPHSDQLDEQVKKFTFNFGYYISYNMMKWQGILTIGYTSQEIKNNYNKFMGLYNENLANIRYFRQK